MTWTRTELPGRYAQAVDGRDIAALRKLFSADITFTTPPALTGTGESATISGADAVAESVVGAVSHLISTRHVVHQQILDGDSGEVYCTAHHLYHHGDAVRDNRIALRYHDRYVPDGSEGEGWLIAARELVVEFSEVVPVRLPS